MLEKTMNNHIKFAFYQGERFDKDVFLEIIKLIQAHGVILASHLKERKGRPMIQPFDGNPLEYLDAKLREVELRDGDEVPIHHRRGPNRLSGAGLIRNLVPNIHQPFSFVLDMFGKKFNMVAGSLITNRENVDVFAKFFLEISWEIYSVLRPAFGAVDFAGTIPGTIFTEVPARQTKRIYWSTFLGPDYVNKYGRKYLLNAPIWKKKILKDGGLFIQLSEHITESFPNASLDEIKTYLVPLGVKYVSWTQEGP